MKLKYYLVALLAIGSLVSCKKENTEDNTATEAAAQKENASSGKVAVVINAIVPKDDDFQLFYSEAGTLDFDHNMMLHVTGKSDAQDITFSLDDDALPASMRIDPGDHKDQGKITINSVTVKYYDKSFVVKGGEELLKYLQPHNLVKESSTANSITFSVQEVNGEHDPMFYPSGDFINAVKGILVK